MIVKVNNTVREKIQTDQYNVDVEVLKSESAVTTDKNHPTPQDYKMSDTLKIFIIIACCFYLTAGICATICYKCCCLEYNQQKQKEKPTKIDYGQESPPPIPEKIIN